MQAVLIFLSLIALYSSARRYRVRHRRYGNNRWAHAQHLSVVGVCLSALGFSVTWHWQAILGGLLFFVLGLVSWMFAARYREAVLAAAREAAKSREGPYIPPLLAAITEHDYETMRRLITAGVEVDERDVYGTTALARAVDYVDLRALRMLLLAGADPNQLVRDGWTPLQQAAHRGRTAMVRMLLDAGALPDKMGLAPDTAIAMAAAGDYDDIVEMLLARGEDVDTRSVGDYTPLMRAAEAGNTRTIRLLLDRGADIGARAGEDEQTSALSLAVASGHNNTVEMLLDEAIRVGHKEPNYARLIRMAEEEEFERIAYGLQRAESKVAAPEEEVHLPPLP